MSGESAIQQDELVSDGKEAQREDGKRYFEQSHNLLEKRNSLGTLGASTW